jgi:hypothetical protein
MGSDIHAYTPWCFLPLAQQLIHDDTKQCATLLELQVQCVVARVHFPHEETWGLYRTLKE